MELSLDCQAAAVSFKQLPGMSIQLQAQDKINDLK